MNVSSMDEPASTEKIIASFHIDLIYNNYTGTQTAVKISVK
jgi:hypothetical protein